jgi:hypothetical protein
MFANLAVFLHIQDGWHMERFAFRSLWRRLVKDGGEGKCRIGK